MLINAIENKRKILANFLEICSFSGWNDDSLKQAFIKSGIDYKFLTLIFENGCLDLAKLFSDEITFKMQEELNKLEEDKDYNFDLSKMKIRDKIKNLVLIRLKINQEYHFQIKELINFYKCPKNIIYAFKNAYNVADVIWSLAGDNATDFNFYSKRIILAKIYIRVILSFSKDDDNKLYKTRNLLDKEIDKVMQFAAFKFKVKNNFNKIDNFISRSKEFKSNLYSNPKKFLRKLPFFRLYK